MSPSTFSRRPSTFSRMRRLVEGLRRLVGFLLMNEVNGMDDLEFHLERLADASAERVNEFVAHWLEVESIVEMFEEA